MKKMFKVFAMIMSLVVLASAFAACSKDDGKTNDSGAVAENVEETAAIVGEWEYGALGAKYIFNDDGTGAYEFGGNPMAFTYEDDGEVLKIKYDTADNVNEFKYTIDGNKLSIEDSFGEKVEYIKK